MDPSMDLGAGSLVDDVDADDLHVLEGLVVPVGLDAADDVHDGHSLDDGPEHGVGVGTGFLRSGAVPCWPWTSFP